MQLASSVPVILQGPLDAIEARCPAVDEAVTGNPPHRVVQAVGGRSNFRELSRFDRFQAGDICSPDGIDFQPRRRLNAAPRVRASPLNLNEVAESLPEPLPGWTDCVRPRHSADDNREHGHVLGRAIGELA